MRTFLLGLAIGAAVASATWALLGERGPGREVIPPPPPAAPAPDVAPVLTAAPPELPEAAEAPETPAERAPVPDGVIVLRLGEGAILTTGEVLPRERADEADVVCLEIDHATTLACAHGGAPARFPQDSPWEIGSQDAVLRGLATAPADLGAPRIRLQVAPSGNQPGVGFAADAGGATWRVWITHASTEPLALDREVHLRRTPVDRVEDGGVVGLPEMPTRPAEDVAAEADARARRLAVVRTLPGAGAFTARGFERETFRVIRELPAEAKLKGFHKSFHVEVPLATTLTTQAHTTIVAAAGAAEDAEVGLKHHSALLIQGDQAGALDVDDHSLAWVDGVLRGQVRVGFHAFLVAADRIEGTVAVGSHAKVLLLDGGFERLDLSRANHAHVLIDRPLNRADIEALRPLAGRVAGRSLTLHLPASDLGPGTHADVAGWHGVLVGQGDLWTLLSR